MPSRRTCQQPVSCLASLLFIASVLLVAVGKLPVTRPSGDELGACWGIRCAWWGIRGGRPVSDVVDAGDLG